MKITRLVLSINGVERPVICDLDRDNLASVIRRMGLTGTKVGCGMGVCGACSVLLIGKVVRSCTIKMKNVPENSEIITIEGIGTPQNLHPLQQAWITYGGVQCGFCTPGFIVRIWSPEGNPSPTRRRFASGSSAQECMPRTGYKPIVDSVMEAAKVMRGEATMEDITYRHADDEDIYGSRYPRPSALAKVTGLCDYGDDIKLKMPEGTAYLAVVISEVPHANIIEIDTSEAEAMPGVYKVMTAKDVKGTNNLEGPPVVPRVKGKGITEFPVICGKKIYKRGDCVALLRPIRRRMQKRRLKR